MINFFLPPIALRYATPTSGMGGVKTHPLVRAPLTPPPLPFTSSSMGERVPTLNLRWMADVRNLWAIFVMVEIIRWPWLRAVLWSRWAAGVLMGVVVVMRK